MTTLQAVRTLRRGEWRNTRFGGRPCFMTEAGDVIRLRQYDGYGPYWSVYWYAPELDDECYGGYPTLAQAVEELPAELVTPRAKLVTP